MKKFPPCVSPIEEPCGAEGQTLSWDGLIGKTGQEAAAIIEKDNPEVAAVIVRPDHAITTDFCCNRVWVFVDDKGIVKQEPKVG